MRMYWADYDADTAHLTTMQHGIYLLLIKNYWQRGGPLPNDDARLARIAKVSMRDWKHNRDDILDFFSVQENSLCHSRIDAELARVEAKSLNNKRPGNANAKRNKRVSNANGTRTPIYTDTDTDKSNNSSELFGVQENPVPEVRPEHVQESYNKMALLLGRPTIRELTPERRQLVRARIAQYSTDDFQTAFGNCLSSAFLRGDRGRTPLTFDWLFKKANFQKVLEGNYNG